MMRTGAAPAAPHGSEVERMSETRAQPDPSMEDILASIRRMITEEDKATGRSAAAEPAHAVGVAVPDDDDVLELTEVLDEPAAVPPVVAKAPAPKQPADDDAVVSEASASAALAALARLSAASPPPAVAEHKGQTVDDLVRELLRPMLKDWLDANLPRLVERAVEREVSRIANGAVRR